MVATMLAHDGQCASDRNDNRRFMLSTYLRMSGSCETRRRDEQCEAMTYVPWVFAWGMGEWTGALELRACNIGISNMSATR